MRCRWTATLDRSRRCGEGSLGLVVDEWAAKREHHRHGPLEHDAVLALLGASDLLVVPSRTIPKSSEQFGRVAVEAMSQSTPVVAYDCGALREVIGDAGFVVAEGDRAGLESAVARSRRSLCSDAPISAREHMRARASSPKIVKLSAEKHVALWRRIA